MLIASVNGPITYERDYAGFSQIIKGIYIYIRLYLILSNKIRPRVNSSRRQLLSALINSSIINTLNTKMALPLVNNYLETYSGRDKILKTLSYTAKLLTVCTSSKSTEKKLKTFGSQISECRVILRLLDDLPMLHYVMTYGWGKKEPDWLIRWSQVIQNIADIIYSPIEHISWAGQHNIVSIDVDKWDLTTTWFWIISLHLSLLRSLRLFQKLQKYKADLKKNNSNTQTMLKEINEQRMNALLASTRYTLDITYAISYLPPGILWGGRLKTWHVGALGTISSLIGLYQALSQRLKN